MFDTNTQPKPKGTVRTPEEIAKFLEKTGFVFEMRANDVFLKAGYETDINGTFLDLEGDTVREIDIVASKVVNDITIHFVVECKQSMTDKWIFICNKQLSRYYYSVKHLPRVAAQTFKEKKIFADFHTFDRSIPLGHNYLCYTIEGDKKGKNPTGKTVQIEECAHKLPKALVNCTSNAGAGRHVFFPLALFTGQLFAVFYKGKLVVEEKPFLQYYVWFESESYRRTKQPQKATTAFESIFPQWGEWLKRSQEEKIRQAATNLSSHYQLDFVTEAGLPEYLARIEKQVAAVRLQDWEVPEPPEEKPEQASQ